MPVALALLAAALLVTLIDALMAMRLTVDVHAQLHEGARQTKDRRGRVTLVLTGDGPALGKVRVALPLPHTFAVQQEILDTHLPAGPWKQLHTWEVTPKKRGHYALDALYITRKSRLYFWEVGGLFPFMPNCGSTRICSANAEGSRPFS
jgi:hypothetical protein